MADNMDLVTYCIDALGFNPFTPQGKVDILELYPDEHQELKEEFPNQTNAFYADSIIQDKVVDEYKDFAEMRGFEPDFGDESYDKSTYQKTLLNSNTMKRLIRK